MSFNRTLTMFYFIQYLKDSLCTNRGVLSKIINIDLLLLV